MKFDLPSVIIEPQRRYLSFTPYWRNDRFLKREFGVPIINTHFGDFKGSKIRNIVITYWAGWAAFNEVKDFLIDHRESQLYRMVNEYGNLALSGDVVKVIDESKMIVIANFPRTKKNVQDHVQMNLNALIFEPERNLPPAPKKYDLIYYGMFRPNRADYFKKYFVNSPNLEIHVSTSAKNILLFKQIGVRPTFIDSFLWGERSLIENFRFSLYIEDIYTHTHYNYPANRFYEGLNFNVITLADISCRGTFDKSGYDMSDYYVDGRDDLERKIKDIKKDYPSHLARQATWKRRATIERKDVLNQLRPIFT